MYVLSNIFIHLQHPISAGHVEFPEPTVAPMSESENLQMAKMQKGQHTFWEIFGEGWGKAKVSWLSQV